MARDFESFIVDPSLLDPSIDATDLRTTTDTRQELLSDVPDYAGIQFDPTRTSYLDDLYALYSGQLFMTPTATTSAVGSPTDEGGGGGVGVETPATITPSTPITTDLTDDQINEFVTEDTTMPPMLSPDMIGDIDTTPADIYTSPTSNVAPDGTTMADMTDDVDMNAIDNPFAGTPVNTPSGENPFAYEDPTSLAIGPDGAVDFDTGPGIDSYVEGIDLQNPDAGAPIEQAPPGIMNPYDPSQSTVLGKPGIDRLDTSEVDIPDNYFTDDSSTDIEDISVELPTTNIETAFDPQAVNTILGPDGITYDAVTGNPIYEDLDAQAAATSITPETESALSQAFRTGKEALDSGMQTISQVGKSIADSVKGTYNDLNKTVEVPGLGEIDIGKTLGGLAINAAVGAPVSLVKYAMDQLPPSKSQLAYDAYTPTQQAIVDQEFGPGGLLDGYNEVSAFGKDAKGIAEDVLDQRLDNVGIDQRTLDLADLVESLGGDVPSEIESTLSGDIQDTGDASVAEGIAAADRAAAQAAAEAAELDRQQRQREADAAAAGIDDSPGETTDASGTEGEDQDRFGGGADIEGGDPSETSDDDFADDFDDGTMTGTAGQGGDYGLGPSGLSSPGSQANSPGNPANQGGGDGDGCFLAGTLVTMADSSTKPVEQVDLKDNVAEGGKVFATGKFLIKNLYDYKGIKVSGSHMVHEDDNWVRVEDSKHGKPLGNDEHTVYVFGSENRRILINDILFTDYFEVNEQNILIKDSEDFFNNSKNYGKIIDKQNVDILNAS